MSDTKTKVVLNFPILGIMFLIFMTLKLTGYIAWSWWWVTAPLWGPLALVVVLGILAFIVLFAWEWHKDRIITKAVKNRR